MGKTIEERANDFCQLTTITSNKIECEIAFKSYIVGADEQEVIDEDHLREVKKMLIDKACEWLKDNCVGLVSYNNASGGQTYPFVENFRKAMENLAHCKEERRLRPYQSREELLDAMKEHGDYVVWEYNHDWYLRILGFSNKRVNIEGHHNTTMEEAMKGFRWADGHPFGKEDL